MRSLALAGLALAMLAVSACSDPVSSGGRPAPSGPEATLATPPPCFGCEGGGGSGGGSYSPLTASVSGPSYVTSAGTVVYTASASGGTSMGRTYEWSEYICYGATGSTCETLSIDPYGTWYIHHYIASNVCSDEVIVVVRDSGGYSARASKVTSGPACLL
jgi:hypothetical protein